ncbi:hypothetical protein BD749_2336 [Pontibacter ramchanderi]|uniref:Uncharacterized protein n=1 Tax=Pontibacter ramchanderi TaxID=1179743 RepID=A0A2N3UCX8_9BACT|nr:hypothetical protein BD749_2336 [Pontibacter ramchanderi]
MLSVNLLKKEINRYKLLPERLMRNRDSNDKQGAVCPLPPSQEFRKAELQS